MAILIKARLVNWKLCNFDNRENLNIQRNIFMDWKTVLLRWKFFLNNSIDLI
jgi:hypothetical protein